MSRFRVHDLRKSQLTVNPNSTAAEQLRGCHGRSSSSPPHGSEPHTRLFALMYSSQRHKPDANVLVHTCPNNHEAFPHHLLLFVDRRSGLYCPSCGALAGTWFCDGCACLWYSCRVERASRLSSLSDTLITHCFSHRPACRS